MFGKAIMQQIITVTLRSNDKGIFMEVGVRLLILSLLLSIYICNEDAGLKRLVQTLFARTRSLQLYSYETLKRCKPNTLKIKI